MKSLLAVLILSTLAVPALAAQAPVYAPIPEAVTTDLPTPDGLDRRSGRCVSREGSACGGV